MYQEASPSRRVRVAEGRAAPCVAGRATGGATPLRRQVRAPFVGSRPRRRRRPRLGPRPEGFRSAHPLPPEDRRTLTRDATSYFRRRRRRRPRAGTRVGRDVTALAGTAGLGLSGTLGPAPARRRQSGARRVGLTKTWLNSPPTPLPAASRSFRGPTPPRPRNVLPPSLFRLLDLLLSLEGPRRGRRTFSR